MEKIIDKTRLNINKSKLGLRFNHSDLGKKFEDILERDSQKELWNSSNLGAMIVGNAGFNMYNFSKYEVPLVDNFAMSTLAALLVIPTVYYGLNKLCNLSSSTYQSFKEK